jgi:hypothetical protein
MATLEIEKVGCEDNSLIRSCKIEINGSKVITPTRTVSLTKSSDLELKVASSMIGKNYQPFGEVYAKLTLDDLNQLREDDEKGQDFSSKISHRLMSLKEKEIVPYLVLFITDNNGSPYNQLLPNNIIDFIFDILWGTPGNSIIVPPLMGLLPDRNSYNRLINALNNRQIQNIDRKELPIMAPVPSSYNLIDPQLLREYWDIGCRLFAFNFENKKYGAFGYMIEKLHRELNDLSKETEEEYILNAFNSRFKIGKQDTSRINNILGSGFGFDIYSPNHIVPKFFQNNTKNVNHYLFNSENYGFETLSSVCEGNINCENILNSQSFKSIDLDSILESPYKTRNLISKFNIESSIKEISDYSKYIKETSLSEYLLEKPKIKNDVMTMKEITQKTFSSSKDPISEWF